MFFSMFQVIFLAFALSLIALWATADWLEFFNKKGGTAFSHRLERATWIIIGVMIVSAMPGMWWTSEFVEMVAAGIYSAAATIVLILATIVRRKARVVR